MQEKLLKTSKIYETNRNSVESSTLRRKSRKMRKTHEENAKGAEEILEVEEAIPEEKVKEEIPEDGDAMPEEDLEIEEDEREGTQK